MSFLRQLIVYLCAVSIHWWWTFHWAVHGVSPNIVLVSAMCVSALCNPFTGHAFSFMAGLYLDMLGTSLFGGYALTFTMTAYAIQWFKRHMDVVSPFSQSTMAWTMSVAGILFYQIVALVFLHKLAWRGWGVFIFEPLLNALITPPVFIVFRTLRKKS